MREWSKELAQKERSGKPHPEVGRTSMLVCHTDICSAARLEGGEYSRVRAEEAGAGVR